MDRVLAMALLGLLAAASHAEIYKWTDAEGRVHFGDKPTGDRKTEEVRVKDYAPGADADTRAIYERRQRLIDADQAVQQKRTAEETTRDQAAAATANQRTQVCEEARAELRVISGPVQFIDENGTPVRTTERERQQRHRALLAWVKENCP